MTGTCVSRHALAQNGSVVLGNGDVLVATEKLGTGSFGAVWRMQGTRGTFALKETISDSKPSFDQSLVEAKLLSAVCAKVGSGEEGLPKYVGHEGVRVADNRYRMRLLMSLMPGEPLDLWVAKSGLVADVNSATSETRELLMQMAKAMTKVETVCVHRDISSHNIMIQETSEGGLKFNLIDFGLAIEKYQWSSHWSVYNLAGDCKYWPPAAWVFFTAGPNEVHRHHNLLKQYRDGLDVFGLGITCLEYFMNRSTKDALPELRAAWDDYWSAVTQCWQQFYACFKGQSDWQALRNDLSKNQTYTVIYSKLAFLRQEMERCSLQADQPFYALVTTLRAMIDPEKQHPFTFVISSLSNPVAPSINQKLFTHVRTVSSFVMPSRVLFTPQSYVPAPVSQVNSDLSTDSTRQMPVMGDYHTPFIRYRAIPTSVRFN